MRAPDGVAVSAAARRAIGRAVWEFRTARRAVERRPGRGALHALRTACRRLDAAIAVYRPAVVLPAAADGAAIAGLARGTGLIRDLDVARRLIERSSAPRPEWKPLRRWIRRARRERLRALGKRLTRRSRRKLVTALRRWVDEPEFSRHAGLPLARIGHVLLRARAERVARHPAWRLDGAEPPDAAARREIHAFRNEARLLRYQLEALEPEQPGRHDDRIEDLRALQDTLGGFHDVDLVEALADRAGIPLGPATALDLDRRRRDRWSDWLLLRRRLFPAGTRPSWWTGLPNEAPGGAARSARHGTRRERRDRGVRPPA
ncbi:MAG: CHAD domain-containing protein [Gemmatimonadales bacterium]